MKELTDEERDHAAAVGRAGDIAYLEQEIARAEVEGRGDDADVQQMRENLALFKAQD